DRGEEHLPRPPGNHALPHGRAPLRGTSINGAPDQCRDMWYQNGSPMTTTSAEHQAGDEAARQPSSSPRITPDPAPGSRLAGGSMRIAVVVHGRFHAFDLARELLALGHDVTLFTNYPRRVAERFGIPGHRVRSYLVHGVLTRIFHRTLPGRALGTVE